MSARPERVGLSGERLARVDSHWKRRYLDPGKIAGALTLVWRRGELAWLSPVGLMDRERGRPMREDTIFRIYSMTKPVTSVALMMLHEHGHFQLDDPVHKFLPGWRELRVFEAGAHPQFQTRRAERPLTIRHLLTHTSGLSYGFQFRSPVDAAYRELSLGVLDRRFPGDLEAFTDLLPTLPLEFSPGDAWTYSVATDVCGRLVEVMSSEPFPEYLRRHVFEPLGMLDTGFHVPPVERDRFAACYQRVSREAVLLDDPETSRYVREAPPRFCSGGGGLVSTAADYLRFCRMLLNGGELDGVRLLGPRTLRLMTSNHLPRGADLSEVARGLFSEVGYTGTGFGLGFSIGLDPVAAGHAGSVGEFAWGGAASTIFWIDPREELIVIFLTQLMPSTSFDFRGQLRSIVYGAVVD